MYKKCLICAGNYESIVLNQLAMRRCFSCGVIWRENFDIDSEYYFSKENNLSESKLVYRINNCKQRAQLIRRYCSLSSTCDIGCGEGLFLKVLRDIGYTDCFGIEPNIHIQDYAHTQNLDVKQGSISDFTEIAKKRKVSLVTMFHVIEHLYDPLTALVSIHQALPTNGHVVIETPNIQSFLLKKTNYHHPLIYPEHLFYFDIETLSKLLQKAGFTVIASGKRDFDLSHQGMRQLLTYFGFMNQNTGSNHERENKSCDVHKVKPNKNFNIIGLVRHVVAYTIARLIHLLGRENYIWVIAKKIN